MLELIGFYLLMVGFALLAIGYLWLLIVAFKVRVAWGLALFFPPLAILFLLRHTRRSRRPLVLLILAGLVIATPYAANYYQRHFVPLKPYEQRVSDDLRITVTGLPDFNYAELAGRKDLIVLQMANENVNDETLVHLKGLDRLRTLDLNNSKITDEGLIVVAALPALQELYLARTKITEDGFQKHLAPKDSLLKLDLTGIESIKGKTKRDWRKAKPGRDYVD